MCYVPLVSRKRKSFLGFLTIKMCLSFFCSIYQNDHNKWTGLPSSAGRHSWTGVHQFTASIHCNVLLHSIIWGFSLINASDVFSCFCQDEYSIFPQTYSIDINGYILVYSVTSNKRSVETHCWRTTAILCSMCWVVLHAQGWILPFLPALKLYKLFMKNCWTWWGKFSEYTCAAVNKSPKSVYHIWCINN